MSQIKEGQNLISMGAGTQRLPHPHVSGSVAVRRTITENLYPLLYPLSQHITLQGAKQ